MKKLLTMLVFLTTLQGFSQTKVVKGPDGKYHSISKAANKAQATGTLYVDSDSTIHTIFKTDSGKYYIMRKSKKTGKPYKQYLKLES